MIPDIDIWLAANLLIQRYGDKAEIVAAQRADEMLDRGAASRQPLGLHPHRSL
jgi:hypothetical protein